MWSLNFLELQNSGTQKKSSVNLLPKYFLTTNALWHWHVLPWPPLAVVWGGKKQIKYVSKMSKYVKKQKNQIYMPAIVLNFEYVLTYLLSINPRK